MSALPAATRMGEVHLRVASIDASLAFYRDILGFEVKRSDGQASLAPVGGRTLVRLSEHSGATRQPLRAAGLYHMALLVPRRVDLGHALLQLADAKWQLQGGSDHAVSEAIYLSDPDGNGIEIYADRPRAEWPRRNGELQMATLPLDVDSLIAATKSSGEIQRVLPAGTTMGHVHLRVPSIDAAELLLVTVLGFDVTARSYPGALFVSAGGYHHHVAANTWAGTGVGALPDNAAGLLEFQVVLPDASHVEEIMQRAHTHGISAERNGPGAVLTHAGGIHVSVVVNGAN